MKVKATKTMTAALNKHFPEWSFTFLRLSQEAYTTSVSYSLMENFQDWDYTRNCMNVIRLDYPATDYALPRFITTNDLINICRHSDGTLESFMNAAYQELAI